jgi:hypothetical protein
VSHRNSLFSDIVGVLKLPFFALYWSSKRKQRLSKTASYACVNQKGRGEYGADEEMMTGGN